MGALDPRAKTCTLYRLLLTPGYREGEEICKYLAAIFEVDTHECFKMHNKVTSALVRLAVGIDSSRIFRHGPLRPFQYMILSESPHIHFEN